MRIRPTISLAMIVKDERANLPGLLSSVRDCFDEIHITDTGSKDGTIEFLQSPEAAELAGCPVRLHHFEWIKDFAAARNASFQPVKTDYVMWMDGDDVLSDRKAFIHFRDTVMNTADYWLATYHYAFDDKGNPTVSFARERVIRMGRGFAWRFFVHEGCVQTEGREVRAQNVATWTIDHRRTEEDIKKDRSRNLKLFADREKDLNGRMLYYFGKELFEAGEFMEAAVRLKEAAAREDLEVHDRLLAIQYAVSAAIQCNQYMPAVHMAMQGLNLMPSRAEYWTLIGDSYIRQNRLTDAVPFYQAARSVQPNTVNGFVFCSADAYERYPTEKLAELMLHLGRFAESQIEIDRLRKIDPKRAEEIQAQLNGALAMIEVSPKAADTDDIVITCPPIAAKPWDDKVHKEVGLGGSETAAVELAEFWQKMTGRQVIIFNTRQSRHVSEAGVEYRPLTELPDYMKNFRPFIHIAWRHSVRLTNAPSYLWCHDLFTPGAERLENYDKILCLSEFHRDYVKVLQNIPAEKVMLMKNGIDPKHFKQPATKSPNKIIFPSSPDRGLDRAIEIVKRARDKFPDLELHVFYGFENMRAMGMTEMVNKLERMIAENPWVHYHGNQPKDVLSKHFLESAVWLYPANFIETFCITALESLAAGCFPIIRNFGGVVDTIRPFADEGKAWIIDSDASTPKELDHWAGALIDALERKKWNDVTVDAEKLSWRAVAVEWIDKLGLARSKSTQRRIAAHAQAEATP